MKVMTKNELFEDFALILEITDAELNFIEEEPTRLYNLELMQSLMKSQGANAHIVQLTINNGVSITPYIEKLLSNYNSVSWINRDNKFYIKRNVTALFN